MTKHLQVIPTRLKTQYNIFWTPTILKIMKKPKMKIISIINISVFTCVCTHVQCSPLLNAPILRSPTTIDGIFTWNCHKRTNLIDDKGIFPAARCIDVETFSGEMHKGLNKNTWTSNNNIHSSENLYFVILISEISLWF